MKKVNIKKEERKIGFFSVKNKLILGFASIIILLIIMIILTYNLNSKVSENAIAIRTINTPLTVMVEQVIGYDAMLTGDAHAALLHAYNGQMEEVKWHKAKYDVEGAELDKLLKTDAPALIKQSRRSDEKKALVLDYLHQLDLINLKLVDIETRAFTAMENGDNDLAFSLIGGQQYHDYKNELLRLYQLWEKEEYGIMEYYRNIVIDNAREVIYVNLILGIIVILFGIAITALIINSVIKPLNKLTNIADDIASGDIDVKIPSDLKKRNDEISELALAYDKLLSSSSFAIKTLIESRRRK